MPVLLHSACFILRTRSYLRTRFSGTCAPRPWLVGTTSAASDRHVWSDRRRKIGRRLLPVLRSSSNGLVLRSILRQTMTMRCTNCSAQLLTLELGLELTVGLLNDLPTLGAIASMHLARRSVLPTTVMRAPARARRNTWRTLRGSLRLQLDLVHALTLHLFRLVDAILREVILVEAAAALARLTRLRLKIQCSTVLLLLTRLTACLLMTTWWVARAAFLGRVLLELLCYQLTGCRVDLVQVLVRLIVTLRRVDVLILVHRVLQFGFARRVCQVGQRLVLALARLNVRVTADLWMRRQLLAVHIQLNVGSRGAHSLLEAIISILKVDRLDVAVLWLSLTVSHVLCRALSSRATELIRQAPLLLGRFA